MGKVIVNGLSRLLLELKQLKYHLSAKDYDLYRGYVLGSLPRIIRDRTLVPADQAMRHNVVFGGESWPNQIAVPLGQIADLLRTHDHTPTFGGMREMYASDVYLRGFKQDLRAKAVLDLGSNRGLFLLLAAARLGADVGIGVEPQSFYTPVFDTLVAANPERDCTFHRITDFVSSRGLSNGVTLVDIGDKYDVERFDFVKCDIEGAEFEIFLNDSDELKMFANLAMELHPGAGRVSDLVAVLRDSGFELVVTDQFGETEADLQRGCYLYASRTSALRKP